MSENVAMLGLGTMGRGMAANLLSILKNGTPGSPLLGAIAERMVSHNYAVNFLLKLMTKRYGLRGVRGVRLRRPFEDF